ncbi:hypothetical protein OESDEN_17908 [Oesophagostomum dentatum]|uniref:Uncharacterized protein n=1 Tax=Oesophagostomum dentatum TaxID=61180 RepID=A0A0B1SAR3_OESDE|nr:hypothetical protein OESDEN_17908 [Oesophagostomum dentatum]
MASKKWAAGITHVLRISKTNGGCAIEETADSDKTEIQSQNSQQWGWPGSGGTIVSGCWQAYNGIAALPQSFIHLNYKPSGKLCRPSKLCAESEDRVPLPKV